MSWLLDAFDMYVNFSAQHPLISSMATSMVTIPLGDIVSQAIDKKTLNPTKYNWKKIGYSTTLAPVYGAGVYGCMAFGENVIGEYVSQTPLVKAALGPNLVGHGFNAYLFYNNTIGEKNDYSIGKLLNNYGEVVTSSAGDAWNTFVENIPKKEYMKSVWGTLLFWNAFQTANYEFIEPHLQAPAALAMSVGWLSALTLWSLRGGRKLAAEKTLDVPHVDMTDQL